MIDSLGPDNGNHKHSNCLQNIQSVFGWTIYLGPECSKKREKTQKDTVLSPGTDRKGVRHITNNVEN